MQWSGMRQSTIYIYSDQGKYNEITTLHRRADVCTAPTLSSLSTSGWSAWSCMSSASLGTAVTTSITSRGLHLEPLGEDDAVQQTRQARALLLQELTTHTVEFRRELHSTSATEATAGSNDTTLAIILHIGIGIRKQIFCMLPEC